MSVHHLYFGYVNFGTCWQRNKCITYLAPTKIKGTRLCLPLYHGKHSLVPLICMHSKLLIPFYYRTLTIEKDIMGLCKCTCIWTWWSNTTHHRHRCCLRCYRYCSCEYSSSECCSIVQSMVGRLRYLYSSFGFRFSHLRLCTD